MSERHKLQCCVGYLSSYKLKESVNLLCRTFCNHNHLCRWRLQRTDYHNTRTEQDPNGGRSHATECRRYQAWFLALLVIRAKCWQHRSDTKYPTITLARQNVAKLADNQHSYLKHISQARAQKLVSQMQSKVELIWCAYNCIDQLQACCLYCTQQKLVNEPCKQ